MIKTVSIFCMLVLIFTSCRRVFDKTDPRPLYLKNNSSQNIIFYKSNGISDINDPNLGNHLYSVQLEIAKKNSVAEYKLFGLQWEGYIESFPNRRMIVFVLDYDSVIKYAGPNTTYGNDTNQILKKQFVSIDTLINNNWTLVYP